MTDFLVKIFIKDYQNTDNEAVRTEYGLMAGIVGILCNVLLFAAKLFIGLLINSISVMADAFHNLSDAASSVIGFIGMKMAGKPADEGHPFGHGRVEYISAFIVAFIIIQVGFSLLKTSADKILHPEEMTFKFISIIFLLVSTCIKLWMGMFSRKLGKRIHSSVMMAASADSLADVATTLVIILSIAVYGIFGLNIDGIMGLLVSVVIMWTGVGMARDTLAPLIGEPIDPKLYREITGFVESFDGIVGSHDLIVHNYGPSRSMASIHAEVPNDVSIEKSHEVIDYVEREAHRRFGIFLVIHMDPIEMKDGRVIEFKSMVGSIVKEIDSKCSIHDFRMVEGESRINLIFDLVVPRDYDKTQREKISAKITKKVTERDSRCCLVITTESGFGVEE